MHLNFAVDFVALSHDRLLGDTSNTINKCRWLFNHSSQWWVLVRLPRTSPWLSSQYQNTSGA